MRKEKFFSKLRNFSKVGVLTGAGISAESGIPTFRGKDGLWNRFNPTNLATFEAFDENPLLVWKWYLWRMHLIARANPNEGHKAIAKMEEQFPQFLLITQNVDGLHRRAGSKRFVELHGYIFDGKCRYCGKFYPEEKFRKIFPFSDREFLKKLSEEELKETVFRELEGNLPKCINCGGIVGPGVVWFGESLPENELERAVEFASRCDLFLSVGTSAVVQPAASIPLIAKRGGATLVEVNPDETPLSPYCDVVFRDSASKVLPRLVEALLRQR